MKARLITLVAIFLSSQIGQAMACSAYLSANYPSA